tara:strand:- start:437 stop:1108 length:672 start_codon:yes stop_codon:yes gene_type:complete
MNKLLITAIVSLAMTGVSYAGSFGIGASGSLARVSADGKEVTGAGTNGTANTNTKSVDDLAMIGSVFLDYEMDNGITLGFSHVPGTANVSDKTFSRSETAQGVSGTDASGSVTRTADAEVENFNTLYVEYPISGGQTFIKAGFSQIDVNTLENAVTNSGTYGNKTLDGYTLGLGFNGSLGQFFTKTSLEYTDFEDLKLDSSTNNRIEADLDIVEFKVALGKRF